MGLLTNLLGAASSDVTASEPIHPAWVSGWWPSSLQWPSLDGDITVATRAQAMQVPTVARARNLLAGTISELPLKRLTVDGAEADAPPWLTQPDRNTPRSTTLVWTVEDLLFHGVAYWQATEAYRDTGRPARFRRIDPARVGYSTSDDGYTITHWEVDGARVPDTGAGSLTVFHGLDEGLLTRAGRTILTALALERAARTYADEPLPAAILKNKGADLPPERRQALIAAWKSARRDGSVGYLNEAIDLETVGYSPSDLQLVDARQHLAVELARACNIPAYFVGAETGGSMTYSNVTAERRTLVDYSLRPFLSAIEQRLSMVDIDPGTTVVRFHLADFLRADARERAEVLGMLLDQGVIDVAEARAMEALTPRGSQEETRG